MFIVSENASFCLNSTTSPYDSLKSIALSIHYTITVKADTNIYKNLGPSLMVY